MAERVVRCWGCGKEPDEEAPRFQICALCRDRKLPATYFCSHECYKNNWPSHKEWHEKQAKGQADSSEWGKNLFSFMAAPAPTGSSASAARGLDA